MAVSEFAPVQVTLPGHNRSTDSFKTFKPDNKSLSNDGGTAFFYYYYSFTLKATSKKIIPILISTSVLLSIS